MIKIKLHSLIDLITNSSTEIYTYSSGSLQACKDMVDEFFKIVGINKTCDEVFDLKLDEGTENCGSEGYYDPQSFLVITPKSSEYQNLAELIHKFLYSTHHEAEYNG